MAVTPTKIIPDQAAPTSTETLYTSSNATTLIDKFVATNTTNATQTISVWLVPSGGSADAGNERVQNKAIVAGESYTFPEVVGDGLLNGDFIAVQASNTGVNIGAFGRLVT